MSAVTTDGSAAQFPRAEEDGGGVQDTSGFFFTEDVTPDFMVKMRLESMPFAGKSAFQDVRIIQ